MAERALRQKPSSGLTTKKDVMPASILGPRLLFIFTTIALLVFGLVMVYSASFVEAFTNPTIQDSSYIFRHQLILVGIGLVVLSVAAGLDYRLWNTLLSWLPWGLVVILLLYTWVMGNEELGGQRWVDVFGFSLQPSEFVKPALVLLLAMLVVKWHDDPFAYGRYGLIALTALAIGIPILLISIQPDLGTTIILLAGAIAIAWFGEIPMKLIGILALLVALVLAAGITLFDFRMDRIDAWLDPVGHASDSAYQIMNAFYAFADGGITGVGLGMSHQKYGYLPQSHNDLIFPIIGEEFGLIGAVAVVLLFLLFLFAAYRIAHDASDLYGRIVAGSAATIIGFQAFLNMLCMANLLPMTGKPLPFFSAGGSSIVVTLMLVGFILNVSFRSRVADPAEVKRDNLRILDGGAGRASGAGRAPVLQQSLRRQTAKAQGAGVKASTKTPQSYRRQPTRPTSSVNPSLRMSPARNQKAARTLDKAGGTRR